MARRTFTAITRIAKARERAHMEQREAAEMLGVSESTYRRFETGKMTSPPLRYLVNCAILFDVPIEALLEPEWLEWRTPGAHESKPPTVDGEPRRSPARLTDGPSP